MMNYHNNPDRFEKQSGLTLVELLIAIVVAVIVGLAVFSILYTTYHSRAISEKLTGRADRALLMKEALEHTVTNAGYTAYLSSAGTTTACAPNVSAIYPAVPTSSAAATTLSTVTVGWTVVASTTSTSPPICQSCQGTFAVSGNVAAWTVSGSVNGGQACAGQNPNLSINSPYTAVFPVGTGWELSVEPDKRCLGPAFNTTAPSVVATNISSQDSGTKPVEVSACLFNLQGQ